MKKLLFAGLFALAHPSLHAQLLSYDFEENDGLFRNEGSLGIDFDLKGPASLQGAANSGVGGRGHALDLTASAEMGGGEGLSLRGITPNAVFPAQKALSVTGWFQTPSGSPIHPDRSVVFIRDSTGGESSSGFLLGSAPDGRLSLIIGNGGVALTVVSEKEAFAEEGKWVFFAATWDGETGNWAWYVGSEEGKIQPAGSGTNRTTMTDSPRGGVSVGRANSGTGAFKGLLDHIHVYDRALSENEVEAIRSAQASGR